MTPPPPLLIDARGLRCPWPVLRLARAFREGAKAVILVADDPQAPEEVAAFARDQNLAVWPTPTDMGNGWRVDCGRAHAMQPDRDAF